MAQINPPVRLAIRLALVALAYGIAARLSLNLALVHGQVTPIWPPTGIALVSFLLLGRGVWPAIYLAAFAVNLPIGPSPLGAAAIAVGNTLAPLVAAELLRRVGFRRELHRLRDAVAIIALGALGMTISATIGTIVLLLGGAISQSQFLTTWAVWWTGDAMGVLLVAPFLLSVFSLGAPSRHTIRTTAEIAGLLVATAVITYVLFLNDLGLEYLVLPVIMLAAWQFHLRGAAPAALVASVVAIVCAINGLGIFAGETLFQKMLTLQVFNVSLAAASFVLVCFIETRERKEEISRLYASAEAAVQAKTRFLHLASHELRTPITVITGYLAMLSDGSLGPVPQGWKKPLDVLTSKTRELNHLVGDLLEASRTEAKAGPTIASRVDLREVVQQAVDRAHPRANLVGAEITIQLPPRPVLIDADATQLGRVLDNLVNNAMTYNVNPPRVALTVSTSGDKASVRVSDNGAGIQPQERERIFEQFHRTNEPSFVNVPGTGLGLYISRQLAEANGGTLSLESSSPEEGAVFLLSLRAVPTPAEVAAADEALASVGQPIGADLAVVEG